MVYNKKLNFAWKICFLNIPVIFHIPKISIFPLLKVFFGIFLEYSIFQIFQYFLVEGLFWNIPFLRFSYSMEYSMEYSVEYSMEYSTFKNELVLRGRKVYQAINFLFKLEIVVFKLKYSKTSEPHTTTQLR